MRQLRAFIWQGRKFVGMLLAACFLKNNHRDFLYIPFKAGQLTTNRMEKIMICQQDCNQFDLAMELLIGGGAANACLSLR